MRVEGAFFAAKVTERPDGRLAGEEFGPFVLSVAEFPFTLSRYVVPILLFFTPQERGRRIALDFTVLGPANTSLMKEQTSLIRRIRGIGRSSP